MKNMIHSLTTTCFILCALAVTLPASAQIIGSGYPPPGGVTNASTGSTGIIGKTASYTSFNFSDYGALYWTLSAGNSYTSAQTNDGSLMSFTSYNAATGLATFDSTENTSWQTAFGNISVPTTLELQFQPYNTASTGEISSGFFTPTTAGAAGITGLAANQSVLNVTGNYQVWYELVADGTGGGQGLTTYYNNSHANIGTSLHTSTSGTFYWTAANVNPVGVPEPSTWCLLLGGLAMLALPRLRAYARNS